MNFREEQTIHIGFDDTDSIYGKCTTHLAFKITSYLITKTDSKFIDYPLLIRLNPNVPWKTRGNAGVCLRIRTRQHRKIIDYIDRMIRSDASLESGANPGLAIYVGDLISHSLKQFSDSAMYDILNTEYAERVAIQNNIEYIKYGNGQGLIGALASVGCILEGDHTFEVIAYRNERNTGLPRIVNKSKVIKFSNSTFPRTFNNCDLKNNRILITPHGPDPVFLGIRGENPISILEYLHNILPDEKLDGYMIFRSNQGTNMHLRNKISISKSRTFISGYSRCIVSGKPKVIKGGHVLFDIYDDNHSIVSAAVYEPTGLGMIASKLDEGDIIDIGFGIMAKTKNLINTLNVEYISILDLNSKFIFLNPICTKCKKRMKSEGKKKGYQCQGCKTKEKASRISIKIDRDLQKGFYIPRLAAHRHLTKPLHRYGMEKTYPYIPNKPRPLFPQWFAIFR